MKKLIVFMFIFVVTLTGCSNDEQASDGATSGQVGSTLEYKEFAITLDDVYYANYPHDGIELNFDNYLAADFSIENISNDSVVAKTLTNFTVTDGEDNLSRVMIDENRKVFNANLMPGDVFEITLVFPVMKSDSYTIEYSYGANASQENVLSWDATLESTKQRKVEETIEHRDPVEVVKDFLLGDGSKKIAFDGMPKTEEEASETSEVTSNE